MSGLVVDSISGKGLPFVTVFCKESKIGTVTNEDGFFELKVLKRNHLLEFRYVGYSKKVLGVEVFLKSNRVELVEEKVILNAVVIRPDDYWMHDLIAKCKRKKVKKAQPSRSYYQLETSVDDEMVELIEIYHNAIFTGYDLEDLKIKNGRVGIKFREGRAYLSGAGSKAMQLYSLFGQNDFFPKTPLNLKSSQIRKHFELDLVRRYHDEASKEIAVIKFTPKKEHGSYFSGKVWIDVSAESVIRIEVHIPDAQVYPFSPLWPQDSLKKVSMDMSRSFHVEGNMPVFDQLEFNYELLYSSRDTFDYVVRTKAFLSAYDSGNPFHLPFFKFRPDRLVDYRQINAIPPNSYFWNDSTQFRMEINKARNELFFNDTTVFLHEDLFNFDRRDRQGLYNNPYVHWNGNRIKLHEYFPDSSSIDPRYPGFPRDQYKLTVQLFLDDVLVGDSLKFVSSTVFDPYDSYYNLQSDLKSDCFTNMYFDIAESWRRAMNSDLVGVNDRREVEVIYKRTLEEWNNEAEQFISEVSRGQNKVAMEKWNRIILKRVGIDNIAFFEPYKEKKP